MTKNQQLLQELYKALEDLALAYRDFRVLAASSQTPSFFTGSLSLVVPRKLFFYLEEIRNRIFPNPLPPLLGLGSNWSIENDFYLLLWKYTGLFFVLLDSMA